MLLKSCQQIVVLIDENIKKRLIQKAFASNFLHDVEILTNISNSPIVRRYFLANNRFCYQIDPVLIRMSTI